MKRNYPPFTKLMMVLLGVGLLLSHTAFGQKSKKSDAPSDTLKTELLSGLSWRSIGPAFTSGRIAALAINPKNHSEYYVGVASGHI